MVNIKFQYVANQEFPFIFHMKQFNIFRVSIHLVFGFFSPNQLNSLKPSFGTYNQIYQRIDYIFREDLYHLDREKLSTVFYEFKQCNKQLLFFTNHLGNFFLVFIHFR